MNEQLPAPSTISLIFDHTLCCHCGARAQNQALKQFMVNLRLLVSMGLRQVSSVLCPLYAMLQILLLLHLLGSQTALIRTGHAPCAEQSNPLLICLSAFSLGFNPRDSVMSHSPGRRLVWWIASSIWWQAMACSQSCLQHYHRNGQLLQKEKKNNGLH